VGSLPGFLQPEFLLLSCFSAATFARPLFLLTACALDPPTFCKVQERAAVEVLEKKRVSEEELCWLETTAHIPLGKTACE